MGIEVRLEGKEWLSDEKLEAYFISSGEKLWGLYGETREKKIKQIKYFFRGKLFSVWLDVEDKEKSKIYLCTKLLDRI